MEAWMLWAALTAYALAGALAISGLWRGQPSGRLILALLGAALSLHALSLGLRWARLGHGPFTTMFEILSSNIFSFTLVYAAAAWRFAAIRPTFALAAPLVFLMMGWLLVTNPEPGVFPPTFDTGWLYVHIGFGKLFMGAALVALGVALVPAARLTRLGPLSFPALPDDESLDELAFRFLSAGLVFDTLMLAAGAIWAQDAWGRYWAFDPLETWSLVTWLLAALAIHTRITLRPPAYAGTLMIAMVFAVAYATFFGVPFVTERPHQGVV